MNKMKKSLIVALLCGGCFTMSSCLTVNEEALGELAQDTLCTAATAGFPYADHLNYCGVIDLNLMPTEDED